MLSMGQKLISQAEKTPQSDDFDDGMILDRILDDYRPSDPALLDSLYQAVEPSDLISKQQTTNIYLTKNKQTSVSVPGHYRQLNDHVSV